MQFLEVVRLEGLAFSPEDVALAGRDMYLLQVSSLCFGCILYNVLFFSPSDDIFSLLRGSSAVGSMRMLLELALSLCLHP